MPVDKEILLERLNNLISTNKQEHGNILEQVKQINGTVAGVQRWRHTATGGFIVSNIIIVPILVAMILKFFS